MRPVRPQPEARGRLDDGTMRQARNLRRVRRCGRVRLDMRRHVTVLHGTRVAYRYHGVTLWLLQPVTTRQWDIIVMAHGGFSIPCADHAAPGPEADAVSALAMLIRASQKRGREELSGAEEGRWRWRGDGGSGGSCGAERRAGARPDQGGLGDSAGAGSEGVPAADGWRRHRVARVSAPPVAGAPYQRRHRRRA
jgi:hypothetical protein